MMDKYVEAEKKLAGLLGWTYKQPRRIGVSYGWFRPDGVMHISPPEWCRYNAAAFALMVEHGVRPTVLGDSHVFADIIDDRGKILANVMTTLDQHPSKEAAVRYAIVMAVIAKLEAQNG